MDHPFTFRPGTYEEHAFRAIVVGNEYRLPESFGPDDLIVDVGTHVGSFCYAAAIRGAGRVYGFEPFAENYECAVKNLAGFADRVTIANKAVWRSDRKVDHLVFRECPENNAGGSVWRPGDGPKVPAVAFDDVIMDVTQGGKRRIRLVKMDCENSEYPILLTAGKLHLVDEIVGEFHEFGPDDIPHAEITDEARVPGYDRYTMRVLGDYLKAQGYEVEVGYHTLYPEVRLGWWFAMRPARASIYKGPFWSRVHRKVRTLLAG